ncbi:hypothetical protein EDD86DRAFT_210283 [Gorgonomyces haynaldii]|nr:hypothetical protein EDD86DRAFT_210283 [Gorgonomyces haynaldii]
MARVILTPLETKIVDILLTTNKRIGSPVVLRIAGGWVRDKLLGRESDDIDIAIDKMTGQQFALHVKEYMVENQMHMTNISTVKINPEKSKHLETATCKIFGLDIDFVNLRTESYNEDSRNPEVEFGTPLEDALRRDITINALFYNLHSQEVEDFSGHGLQDLKDKIVRTPLPPHQTFLDDPLRVLRVIRFATRLGYQMLPEIVESGKQQEIQKAFEKKISRERVGVEIEKTLSGNDPKRALDILMEIGWFELVFTPPEHLDLDLALVKRSFATLDLLLQSPFYKEITWNTTIGPKNQCYLYLASLLLVLRKEKVKVKNKDFPVSKHIILNALKLSNADADTVHALINNIEQTISIVNLENLDRKRAGWHIRDLGERPLGSKWDLAVLMALVYELQPFYQPDGFHTDAIQVQKKYKQFIQHIFSLDLQDVYAMKPLLNGQEIATLLGIKPGPKVGQMLPLILDWQLGHPAGTKQELQEWLSHHH